MNYICPSFKIVVIVANTLQLYEVSLFSAMLYYAFDLYLECRNKVLKPMYITHHVLSLGMVTTGYFIEHMFLYEIYINIVTLFELTGLFCDIYAMFPKSFFSRRLLCVGYIPIRCLIIPYILLNNKPFDYCSHMLNMCCHLLVCGSMLWSFRLIKTIM